MRQRSIIKEIPIKDHVAAISCGVSKGVAVLDLDYDEDSVAETDANFVMTGAGGLVEVQATAEGAIFTQEQLDAMLGLARKGIADLVALQKAAINS
jgi:ribonuclease PH